MAELKTKPTEIAVESFLDKNADPKVRADCDTIISMMERLTGEKPKMWGPSIVGFGKYRYKYESGREGEICITGFSPRKPNITLYVTAGFEEHEELLAKLGKHKASKGCLYIKRLADIDINILERLVKGSIDFLKKKYPDAIN